MQAGFKEESTGTAERRYRPETVQKAAALAARLQQERRETLSESEVEKLAEEIGIEPELMRQALATVAQTEAAASPVLQPAAQVGFLRQPTTQTQQVSRARALLGLSIPLFFGIFTLGMIGLRSSHAPLAPTVVAPMAAPMELTPPVAVTKTVAPAAGLLRNGGFEAAGSQLVEQSFLPGSTSISGWVVASGEVTRIPGGVQGSYALRLGDSGSVTQRFRTVPSQRYRVSLALAGTPGPVGVQHRIEVSAPGASGYLSAFTDVAGSTNSWERKTIEFTAEETSTQLTLSTDRSRPDVGSPIIDDVIVTPVR
ncbi:MAG: hypothetical protein K0Q72_1268 [Armatimonadetes bacterium]|jgi:hypothetical protein|nr:hypothetical protein [Armatimonadota bacterium]